MATDRALLSRWDFLKNLEELEERGQAEGEQANGVNPKELETSGLGEEDKVSDWVPTHLVYA